MKKQYVLTVLLTALVVVSLYSQDLPRLEADPFFLDLSTFEGNFPVDLFIEASLKASGLDNVEPFKGNLIHLINEISASVENIDDDYDRGEAVLKALHNQLFKAYREDQTRIDIAFQTGIYNCVSSAVIYMAAGRQTGLDIRGVRTTDHAFVSVKARSRLVDVETTNIWGFDPGQKKEFIDSFTGSTGYNYVPPGNYHLRKDLSDGEMIGLILQNRIAILQRQNNHKESIPLAIDRFVLSGTENAKKDMFDTFSNYASRLNLTGQYEIGIKFLSEAIDHWGNSEKPRLALEALIHNHLLSMVERGLEDEALNFLDSFASLSYISSKSIQTDRSMIYDRKTVDMLNSGEDFYTVKSYLQNVYDKGFLDRAKWIDYTVYNYIKETKVIANRTGWLDAYLFAEKAPDVIKNNTKYRQLLSSCRGNYVVTVHNQFADLFNSRQYGEAEKIIREGLSFIPEDGTLKADLQLLKRKKAD